jgi:UPF0716 family protein affecting phage T7 exclusion
LKTFHGIRTELRGGRLPPNELLDGILILVAGALMLTPGVLTDLVAIALLVPRTRAIFRRWLVEYLKSRLQLVRFASSPTESKSQNVEIIDSYVVSQAEERKG